MARVQVDAEKDKAKEAQSKNDSSNEESEVMNPADRSLFEKIIRKGLVENKSDLEVQRRDPTSPLYHVKTFEELNLRAELLKGLYNMGFNAPSRIQVNNFLNKFLFFYILISIRKRHCLRCWQTRLSI